MKAAAAVLIASLFVPQARGAASRVTAVTVFKDRASVRRTQTVKLPKGAHSIAFEGVTPRADRDSLKAFLSEKKAVRVLGLRTETRHRLAAADAEKKALREEEKTLRQRLAELEEQGRLLQRRADNLSRAARHYQESFSLNLHRNVWSPAGFQGFLGFLDKQAGTMHGAWKKLFEDYDRTARRLDWVSTRLSALQSASDTEELVVFVDVIADGERTVRAEIQYLVEGAGWAPLYDLRLSAAGAALEQHAMVWQSTGEDWEDVALTLSNSPNELKTDPPELEPYRLTYRQVEVVQTSVASRQQDKIQLAVGGAGEGGEEEDKSLSAVFKVPHRQTLREAGGKSKIFVARRQAPYEEHLALVAAQYPKVFRRGEMKNPFPWRLAPGNLALYADGEYLQTTRLDAVPKGGEIAVNAGVDHHLRVTRELLDETGTSGMLQKQDRHTRRVKVAIENFSSTPKKIRVYEPVPVSEMEAVKVAWKDESARNGRGLASRPEPQDGWLTWDVAVPARKSETVKLELEVTTPRGYGFGW